MVKCITKQTVILPASQCQDYSSLLTKLSAALERSPTDIKVFFIDAKGLQTEIQSDADVLGVKYIARTTNINFTVVISMSRQEVEEMIMREQVQQSLSDSYKIISKKIVEEQMKLATQIYLNELYAQIAEEQSKISMIEEEEISQYMLEMRNKISNDIYLENISAVRWVKRENVQEKNSNKHVQSELQICIEKTVTRVLQSMMPQMVRAISSRIIDELQNSKISSFNSLQKDQNPEQV